MVASTRRQSSNAMSANGVSARTAALLTSMSRRPNSFAPDADHRGDRAGVGDVGDAAAPRARPPSGSCATVSSASSREVRAFTITAAPPAASAQRDRAADVARAAGHQGDFAGKLAFVRHGAIV